MGGPAFGVVFEEHGSRDSDDRTGDPEQVVLERLDVDDVASLLGLLEDWLTHADPDIYWDVREF